MALLAVALMATTGRAQDTGVYRNTLTNRDVMTLADAGFSEEFLIEMVSTSRTKFDTSAEGLADLVKHGLKEDLIRAIRQAQDARPAPAATPAPASSSAPAVPAMGAGKPIRVFVQPDPYASMPSMSYSQTAAIAKTLGEKCSNVVVTSRRDAATFTVVLGRTAGKLFRPGDSRLVVLDRSGDVVFGASERGLSKALSGFCSAVPNVLAKAGEGQGGVPDGLPGAR
jgi:hypothetical protein